MSKIGIIYTWSYKLDYDYYNISDVTVYYNLESEEYKNELKDINNIREKIRLMEFDVNNTICKGYYELDYELNYGKLDYGKLDYDKLDQFDPNLYDIYFLITYKLFCEVEIFGLIEKNSKPNMEHTFKCIDDTGLFGLSPKHKYTNFDSGTLDGDTYHIVKYTGKNKK